MISFVKKVLNYAKKNLKRDVLWFNFNTKYYPFSHKRNVRRTVMVDGKSFAVVDFLSFVWQYKEIFIDSIYKFHSRSSKEIIIDCGANVGLATHYFAKNYPNATIHTLEADPKIFNVLKTNIQSLYPKRDIHLINKAVWKDGNSEIYFHSSGDDAGKIIQLEDKSSLKVPTVSLQSFLQQFPSVDMLKIDIEGAERTVFPTIEPSLKKIKNLFLEYHCWVGEQSFLGEVITILERNQFKFEIEIISRKNYFALDSKTSQQYNIFAVNQNPEL